MTKYTQVSSFGSSASAGNEWYSNNVCVEDESSRSWVKGQEVHKPHIEHLIGLSDRSA